LIPSTESERSICEFVDVVNVGDFSDKIYSELSYDLFLTKPLHALLFFKLVEFV